jgi:hypothetical protein
MIALTDAFAAVGIALALCAGALSLRRFGRHKNDALSWWVRGLLLALFIALLIPKPGASIALAAFFRGFIGDLSISLLALGVWSLCHRLFDVLPISKRELTALLGVVGIAALLLYPTALGWGDWDAYRLGWGSWPFLLALLALCGVSASMGLRVLPALVALALLAWSVGLMESGNLWDYLLDPWLSAFALGFIFIKCVQFVRSRFH